MPISPSILILQAVNIMLAASSGWIYARNPHLWHDQAIIYSTVSGFFLGCTTLIALGISMTLQSQVRWTALLVNIVLGLGAVGLQGWVLQDITRYVKIFRFLHDSGFFPSLFKQMIGG